MKSSESRQLGVVFADNSKESEPDPKPDESIGRSYLLHTADDNLTSETDAPVDDQETCHDRLLERVASLPNLARALLFVARNKGAAGVDGISTEEIVEAAPDLLPKIREALISGTYQPGDIRRARVTQVLNWLNRVEFNSGLLVDFFTAANPIEHSLGMTIKCRRSAVSVRINGANAKSSTRTTWEQGRKSDRMLAKQIPCFSHFVFRFSGMRSLVNRERRSGSVSPTALRILAIADVSNLSPDEFVKLTLEYEGRFFSVVLAMLPGCSDAEDIVQEAITIMWQKSEQFQRGTDFGAWGCRIVRLKVMEHLRNRRGDGVVLSPEAMEMVALNLEKSADDLAARTAALKNCLAKLEPASRELITIRFHPKMTLKNTAEQLGKSEPTIRKSVRKILRQLERCVEQTLGIDTETAHE